MRNKKLLLATLCSIALYSATITPADACTRIVYTGDDGMVVTGRTMDWTRDPMTDLWLFPRGMQRNGEVAVNSLKWTSKYGSVIAAAYNLCTTDGMNEVGLAANLLWLAESVYPKRDTSKPGITISEWTQYVLDNFATVAEAVDFFQNNEIQVVSDMVPDENRLATLHLSISDPTGDSAIFEYINGKLTIHHSPAYVVMTNSPVYNQQLALNSYWESIGGLTFLPGTNRAADRFARASFYVGVLPKTNDPRNAVAGVFSVIRNASVPLGISVPDEPNIASTRWRTVADQKNLVYFYESTLQPNVFWVDFANVDFSKNAPVKMLNLISGKTYAGNTASNFVKAAPFNFLGVSVE